MLKDLGKTLGRGQKSKLYRKGAYDTSLLVVKESEGVFREVEEILKKSTKNGGPLGPDASVPRKEKFLWIFRKSRVQLLRGNLESLKSTILLQLAVLNYADKISSSPSYAIQRSTVSICVQSLMLC